MSHRTLFVALATVIAGALLAGCGSGGSAPGLTVQPAHIFGLSRFKPSGTVRPGRRTVVSFRIHTPSGGTLTQYKKCCDPHAGVDLIIVRSDDSHVQYIDADAEPDGSVSVPVTFPAPGRYRIVVDAYPKVTGPSTPFNFQLFRWVTVRGKYREVDLARRAVVRALSQAARGTPQLQSNKKIA